LQDSFFALRKFRPVPAPGARQFLSFYGHGGAGQSGDSPACELVGTLCEQHYSSASIVYYWVLVQSLEMLSLRKGEKTGVKPPTKDEGPTATSSVIFICGQREARKVRSASQNFGQGLALAVTRAGLRLPAQCAGTSQAGRWRLLEADPGLGIF
jgi:hypothetical protein